MVVELGVECGGNPSLAELFLPPFSKEVYSKRKEFAPKGSKIFSFKVDNFLEEDWSAEKQG